MSFAVPAAQAARSLDDVLARFDALEKENASLRKRVQRLESTDRERPVVASLPASEARSASVAARRANPAIAAIPPAASQAYAADMLIPERVRNWTGLYLGASAGLRREDHKWTTNQLLAAPIGPAAGAPNNEDFNDTGARFGGFLGYNVQVSPKFVLGIEGDVAWGDTKTSTKYTIPGTAIGNFPVLAGFSPNDSSEFKTEWDASLRGRVGALIMPDTLAYLTGGVAWQKVKATVTCDGTVLLAVACFVGTASETQSKTLTGWTLGAGVETTIGQYWTGRIEYRYADYGDFNHVFLPNQPFGGGRIDTSIALATHTFSAGLAYKFGGY
jgi:outer membrane immunogenic protein